MALVCLPWYDLPETRGANQALWARMVAYLDEVGVEAPRELDWAAPYSAQWDSGDLLFGQACGYDVLISSADDLQLVATPRYVVPGCEGHTYRSFIVVRAGDTAADIADLRGGRCVINTPTSHSGTNVLRAMVAPLHDGGRFFASVSISGAHERSLQMIARGDADVAAIDCVTHGLIARHRPAELAGTRVLCQTRAVPAPPFVTARSTPAPIVDTLRVALTRALADPELAGVRAALAIAGADNVARSDYCPIDELRRTADAHGYFEIVSTQR